VRKSEVPVRCPQRISRNIGDDDRLASIGGSAAGTHARTNLSTVYGLTVFSRQGRRSPVAQSLGVGIKQENRAQQAAVMGLDVRTQSFQDLRERGMGHHHGQNFYVETR